MAHYSGTLGIFQIATGFVGFLANTAPRLDGFARDFKGCDTLLRGYSTRLHTLHKRLEAWVKLWCTDGVIQYDDDDHAYFWGEEGMKEINNKLRFIDENLEAVGQLLMKDSSQISSRHGEWTRIKNEGHRWQRVTTDIAWLKSKIMFAWFNRSALDNHFRELKDTVDDLLSGSETYYYAAQYTREKEYPITGDEQQMLLSRRDYMKGQSKQLTKLYTVCQQLGQSWSLILTSPDMDSSLTHVENEEDIKFQFAPSTEKCQNGILFTSFSEMQTQELQVWIAESLTQRVRNVPLIWSPPIDSLLQQKHGLQRQLKARRMAYRLAIVNTALGISMWSVLLWDTPWTIKLCSCRMRFAILNGPGDQIKSNITFTSMKSALFPEACHIKGDDITARRALLLGVALAELALGVRIMASLDSHSRPLFCLFDNDKNISKDQLLTKIGIEFNSTFKKVISYCFFYDSKIKNENRGFRPRDMLEFQKKVIEP
jgi:hypothetical protein